MKSLILILLFGLMISLTSSCRALAQETVPTQITVNDSGEVAEQPQQVEKQGFFARIWDDLKGKASDGVYYFLIGLVGGIFSKRGWVDKIKYWMGYYVEVSHELSELLEASSNGVAVLNNSLQSNGKLKPNSLEEIKKAGKPVLVEFGDFKAKLTPKK